MITDCKIFDRTLKLEEVIKLYDEAIKLIIAETFAQQEHDLFSSPLIMDNQMTFKVGDKVKITQATIDKAKDVYKDFDGLVGEIIKHDKIYNFFKVKIGSHSGLWFDSLDIEMIENSPLKSCVCESWDLFNKGCTCGYIRKNNG